VSLRLTELPYFTWKLDSLGKLSGRKVEGGDARVLIDLGVDIHFAANYLVVEGECDRTFWESASRQLTCR